MHTVTFWTHRWEQLHTGPVELTEPEPELRRVTLTIDDDAGNRWIGRWDGLTFYPAPEPGVPERIEITYSEVAA